MPRAPVWHLKEGCGQMVSITADTVLSDWVSMILFFYGRKHSASYFCHMSNVKAIRVGRAPHFKMKL